MSSYERLYSAYQKCYQTSLTKQAIQQKCNDTWKILKASHTAGVDLTKATEEKIKELNEQATKKSAKFRNYFVQVKINITYVTLLMHQT